MVPRLQGEALPPVLVINGDHPVDDLLDGFRKWCEPIDHLGIR
jgi:hypothetical protein